MNTRVKGGPGTSVSPDSPVLLTCLLQRSHLTHHSVSPVCLTCADEWTKEDCLTLLDRIRTLLPEGDTMKYKTTESHFDWDKVGFGGFSGDMCRQKWQRVSSEVRLQSRDPVRTRQDRFSHRFRIYSFGSVFQVRKYRTMTELIVDAMEFVKNPYKGKKLKVSGSTLWF